MCLQQHFLQHLCLQRGKKRSTSKANTESISTDASAKDNGERTIIDHAGNEVTLPEEINRIVVTDTLPLPSVLSLYLDSAEKLVGISPVSMSAAKLDFLVSCIRRFWMRIRPSLKTVS